MSVPQTEIIVTANGGEVLREILAPGDYVIGRESDCDLVVAIEMVSRKHARLTIQNDCAVVEDLGSSNGTSVNKKPVTGRTRLWPNQKIQVGLATIELRRVRSESTSGDEFHECVRQVLPAEFFGRSKYDIGGLVAQGGMGAILDAREANTGRVVAMKMMLAVDSPDSVMRFVAEAKVTAQLEHPNIVPVHELGVDENDQVFYTMKFVKGVTLRAVLRELREGNAETLSKYPLPALLTVFQKVCDALAFSHSRNVIHRDLKPDNIMIGDYGEVLVMDWGLARVGGEKETSDAENSAKLSPLATMAGQVMGTPAYMSPEQARGEIAAMDARTDIYSLGAILYHILAISPSVSGRDALEVVDKVGLGKTTPLAEAVANPKVKLAHLPAGRVPASLSAVVCKAMAFEAADRYPAVEALQADLVAYQSGFATGAENAGAGKHLALFIKRHKAVSVATLTAVALLACISVAFTSRLLIEKNTAIGAKVVAERERQRAEESLGIADGERKRAEGALASADSERKRAENALVTAESERQRAETERSGAEQARSLAEDQRKRAEQALDALKETAPTFFALAKSLLEEGKIDGAIEKAGYAIQLDEGNADYLLFRANLLEATLDLAGAVAEYRHVLKQRPEDGVAKMNMALCERLLAQNAGAPTLPKELQKQLLTSLREQNRLIEAGPLTAIVEPDYAVADAALRGRLREYRKQPGWDDSRLSRNADGSFKLILDSLAPGDLSALKGHAISDLSLSYTGIEDLGGLAGLPLKRLVLNYSKVRDLSPLHGMPLEDLDLIGLAVTDLSPLAGMKLKRLNVSRTQVSDLRCLAGMPLESISANNTRVADLSPLKGMPLVQANFSASHASDLRPLGGAPLTDLDIGYNQINDLKPLSKCTKLKRLSISHTAVADLSPLSGLGLAEIDLSDTNVSSLVPLNGHPLRTVRLDKTFVTDLTPLSNCLTLTEIVVPADAKNVLPLRKLTLLKFISTRWTGEHPSQSASEFWRDYDAKNGRMQK